MSDSFDKALDMIERCNAEITRLRAENERLQQMLADGQTGFEMLAEENRRLLAANRDVMLHWDVLKADYEQLRAALEQINVGEGWAALIARAAIAAQPAPSPWRPIDEAPVPKDGSYFAICRAGEPDTIECGRYDPYISHEYEPVDGGLYRKKEWVGYEWSGINNMHRATHWMPLPPAPKEVE